jgi:type IV secretion system protein VirB10
MSAENTAIPDTGETAPDVSLKKPQADDRGDSPSSVQPVASAPEAFRLRGDPPRVMRLSRKTLAIMGAAIGLGIGGALIYALRTPGHEAARELYNTQSRNTADVVTSAPSDYAKVPKLGPALPGDLGRPILSAQANGKDVSTPPMGSAAASQDPRLAAAEQARQRVTQERESARTSTLFTSGSNAASGASSAAASTVAVAPAADTQGGPVNAAAAPTGQNEKREFLKASTDRTTISPERIAPPVSPNILQAGSIIPAALITGIRSDLPGQITAQVTQNVYDSPTGRILLIPQGARLIGQYDSTVSTGQNRVLLAWDRLILPGGRSILLDRQPGADAAGMAGLQDRTNYHWDNMLKAAMVSTLLGAGAQLVTNGDDALTQAIRYGTQDTINQTGQKLVQRQIDVPPTLTVRPGYPLNVIVTRDLVLDPAPTEYPR